LLRLVKSKPSHHPKQYKSQDRESDHVSNAQSKAGRCA
jgi:hypothetical protein